ncbi:hypothetical protein MTR_2g094530 [Medicago truncatula]|uniref:Uncharacterized protein n=1 Tax=Medicago truncatula TaxID=3880 RepID=G7IRT8_MEDTR|nr:hypothetical protein MTR_2g094530 [Medicago truncatula]
MHLFRSEESKINSENLLNGIQIWSREETAHKIIDPNTTVARFRREEEEPKDDIVSKKAKVDDEKSVEEERLERLEKNEGDEKEEKEASGGVNLGPKTFGSSLDMFYYFHKFLHAWLQNLNVNKYEHMMLLELLKNGGCMVFVHL